jgi:hypothetical protein
MTAAKMRQRIKGKVDELPKERLAVADDFLTFLVEREEQIEGLDLRQSPKLQNAIRQAEADFKAGRCADWRKVRNDL